MADKLSAEKRSWNMSRIHSKDTSIEIRVRRWLFQHGYRYRKNVRDLPGKPDIVMQPYKTVIFIQGCFWHRHPGCKDTTTPKSNTDFWEKKFKYNVANDIKHKEELEKMGYSVIVLWECEINKKLDEIMEETAQKLGPPRHNMTTKNKSLY